MTDEQFERLALLLSKPTLQPVAPSSAPLPVVAANFGDNLMKFATALCTAGVLWLITSVSTMKTDQAVMQTQMTVMANQITTVESNTKDRFTREDFIREKQSLVDRVDVAVSEMANRKVWMDQTEKRITQIESEIEHLGNK